MTVAFGSPLTSDNLNDNFISRTDDQQASGKIDFVDGIEIDGIELTKSSGVLVIGGDTGVKLPIGSTAERPSAGDGTIRYNDQTNTFEGFSASAWGGLGGGGGPSLGTNSIIRTNAQTINEDITFVGNENGMSIGPITIASGYTVTVTTGSTWVVI